MPVLLLESDGALRSISFKKGQTIREILDTTDLRVRSACRGNGMCGLCHVKIINGKVNDPLPNERASLSKNQLQNGIRLACQVIPEQDVQAVLLNPAPKSNWRSLTDSENNEAGFINGSCSYPPSSNAMESLGAAVDLGTTHISLTVWDMERSFRLSGRKGLNEQHVFGSDVITRLLAACESKENLSDLSSLVKQSIKDALNDILTRDCIDSSKIKKMAIVGNTAMLLLLAGKNCELLLKPAYWSSPIDCQPKNTEDFRISWGIDKASSIQFVAPVAGFVGSDLLAGVLAARLTKSSKASLLIDFGTNSEIALWDGTHLWVTSAAGGPAFEGCGITSGMPAEPGAVCSVMPAETGGTLSYTVLSGIAPQGFCGSGLVDLIACLIEGGEINAKGGLNQNNSADSIAVLEEEFHLRLYKRDIDVFQRAKAAIATGITILMENAGISFTDLQRVCVCGAFGRFLNIQNAKHVGLLPDVPDSLIELCGNTALSGCEMLLVVSSAAGELEQLRKEIKFINMADSLNFDELFVENLYLKPMKRDFI